MAVDADVEAGLRAKFDAVLPHLDERAAQLVLAGEARSLGHGGIAAVADYGRTSRIPVLWVSAANDHFFGPRLVTQLTAAFTKAGGTVTYVPTAPFSDDGHKLFDAVDGMPIWSPIVDQFLLANKLALRDGLNRSSVAPYLTHTPVVKTVARGRYTLRGEQ